MIKLDDQANYISRKTLYTLLVCLNCWISHPYSVDFSCSEKLFDSAYLNFFHSWVTIPVLKSIPFTFFTSYNVHVHVMSSEVVPKCISVSFSPNHMTYFLKLSHFSKSRICRLEIFLCITTVRETLILHFCINAMHSQLNLFLH